MAKKRVTQTDWDHVATYVCDEHRRRRDKRKDLDKEIKEIDRQVAMIPDASYKLDSNGKQDKNNAWMPETELPLQAQTLEVLTADARRMLSPDSGPWFTAHANMSDAYLNRVDFESIISGDENDVPTRINQDNADSITRAAINHFHRQYDFWGHLDRINAEAFKYSVGIGRVRKVSQMSVIKTATGMKTKKQNIPVLVPRSLKNTFLDDNPAAVMNEGIMVNSSIIEAKSMRMKDIELAARRGGDGWVLKNLEGLEGDDNGNIEVIQFEGDMVIPRKTTRSMYLPNSLFTVVIGKKGKDVATRVIRYKSNVEGGYIEFPYHQEEIGNPYATSPLMKGMPIQKAAVDALNRLLMVSALHSQPPVQWDADDPYFSQHGGPKVFPGASWGSTGDITTKLIGDPSAMFNVYMGLLNQYYDVTGVNAPRLGAQTVSHTTAYAKEAELSRGTVRTVDYVKSTLAGPLTKYLNMAYNMGRESFSPTTLYIENYGGFVDIEKKHLPDQVVFDAHGAGGPLEEQAKVNARLSSLQFAMQIDQMSAQYQANGLQSRIDMDAAIEQVLLEGKWNDVDSIIRRDQPVEQSIEGQGMGQLPGIISEGTEL